MTNRTHVLTIEELQPFCDTEIVDAPVIPVDGEARCIQNRVWDSMEDVRAELKGKKVYVLPMRVPDHPGTHKFVVRCWYAGMEAVPNLI